jgi:hypothetical protein
MKKLIYLSICGILALSICFSCKSTKLEDTKERVVIIELKNKFDEEYIPTNYETYKPIKVKRSNKKLNQYTSTFSLDDVFYKGLINRLNNDPNVVRIFEISSSKVDAPLNSTNQQRSSAKPIVK